MATILKLVCVKGLRGYARFAVLFFLIIMVFCLKAGSVLPKQLHGKNHTEWFVFAFLLVVREFVIFSACQ